MKPGALEGELSDDELTELALAADPDAPLDADAVALPDPRTIHSDLLPAWYMPAARTLHARHSCWRTAVVIVVVTSLLLINALGLCITYGRLSIT